MKLGTNDIEQIRSAFAVCRVAGIDAVVLTENKIRGVAPSTKMALISPANFSFDSDVKIGIGRLSDFEKRLTIFAGVIEGEGKTNDKNEVSTMTLRAGKSSVQYRCTAERMIKYAKENEDPVLCRITATKSEITQVSRATKSLGAETLTIAVGRDSKVRFECASPTNESFNTEIGAEAEHEGDPQALVHTYEGDRLASVLEAAVRDEDTIELIVGESGSLTIPIKGHVLIAIPEYNTDEDDDE